MMLAKLVKMEGSQANVAREMGMTKQEISNALRLVSNPPRKLLEHFNLVPETVYVPKGSK